MAEQTRKHPKLRLGRLVVWSVVVLLVALVVVNLTVARLPEMPPAGGRYISLHGKEIHYFEQPGQGVPVVMIHGEPRSHEDFDPVVAELPGAHLISIDRPGFGWSKGRWLPYQEATTYQLLTGLQLFTHSNPAVVISRHLNTTPPTLSDRRPDCAFLDDVFQIALAKIPQDRFPSCSAFVRALVDASPGQGAASANTTTQAAPQPRRSAPTSAARSPAKPPDTGSRRAWVVVGSIAAVPRWP